MRRTNDSICIKCTLFVLSVIELIPNNKGISLYYLHVFVKNIWVKIVEIIQYSGQWLTSVYAQYGRYVV